MYNQHISSLNRFTLVSYMSVVDKIVSLQDSVITMTREHEKDLSPGYEKKYIPTKSTVLGLLRPQPSVTLKVNRSKMFMVMKCKYLLFINIEDSVFISSPEPSGSQGELIVYPCSVVRPSVVHHFQRSSSLKQLGQSKPNFTWSIYGKGEPMCI